MKQGCRNRRCTGEMCLPHFSENSGKMCPFWKFKMYIYAYMLIFVSAGTLKSFFLMLCLPPTLPPTLFYATPLLSGYSAFGVSFSLIVKSYAGYDISVLLAISYDISRHITTWVRNPQTFWICSKPGDIDATSRELLRLPRIPTTSRDLPLHTVRLLWTQCSYIVRNLDHVVGPKVLQWAPKYHTGTCQRSMLRVWTGRARCEGREWKQKLIF